MEEDDGKECLQQGWEINKMKVSIDDFLLTHNVAWITEEEFHRNKTIANSTITTPSYSPVVWNNTLLDDYNKIVGLTSTDTEQRLYFDAPFHSFMNGNNDDLTGTSTINVLNNTASYSNTSRSEIQRKSPSPLEMLFEGMQGNHLPSSSVFTPTRGTSILHNEYLNTNLSRNTFASQNLLQHDDVHNGCGDDQFNHRKVHCEVDMVDSGCGDSLVNCNSVQSKGNLQTFGHHKCTWCTSCFLDEEVLVAHRKKCRQRPPGVSFTGEVVVGEGTSASGGGKVHQCPECGKVLATAQNLHTHMLLHTGLKSFECQECGKRFTTKQNLTTHLLTHTGELPHKCEVCGKGFTQKGTLTTHMRTHCSDGPYLCGVCGQGFKQNGSLKTHMYTHTGATPFKCEICGKGFKQSGNLTSHIRVHTGEKPYPCPVCGQRFTQGSSMRAHIKRVHSTYNV